MSLLVNQRTLGRVWYLAEANDVGLMIRLAHYLKNMVFPPQEFCPVGYLYVLQRGICLYAGRTRRDGGVWGEDVLLESKELQLKYPAFAVSYLMVFTIAGEQLNDALMRFPDSSATRHLLRLRRRWTIRRALVRLAERMCYARGDKFRDRDIPIYAHDVRRKMEAEKQKVRGAKSGLVVNRKSQGPRGLALSDALPSQSKKMFARLSPSKLKGVLSPSPSELQMSKSERRKSREKVQLAKEMRDFELQQAAARFGIEVRHEQMLRERADAAKAYELANRGAASSVSTSVSNATDGVKAGHGSPVQPDTLSPQTNAGGFSAAEAASLSALTSQVAVLSHEMASLQGDNREILRLLRELRPEAKSTDGAKTAKSTDGAKTAKSTDGGGLTA